MMDGLLYKKDVLLTTIATFMASIVHIHVDHLADSTSLL
jgi:hypothetical protein